MQNRSRILAFSLAAIAIAGCSSMGEKSSYSASERVSSPSQSNIDEAYVAAVEIRARRYGADVIWVNIPTKHITSKNAVAANQVVNTHQVLAANQ